MTCSIWGVVPERRLPLFERLRGYPILSISEHSTECVADSVFCLQIGKERIRFRVNLDALARSGVRVHPAVLKLAKADEGAHDRLVSPPNQRLTLRQSLGRTHLVTSLTAVCMAGVLLTGIALLVLRLYADHNLELVARAISYTSEVPWCSTTKRQPARRCRPSLPTRMWRGPASICRAVSCWPAGAEP